MLNEEQVIDVTAEEVAEQEHPVVVDEQPGQYIHYDQYVDFKKQTYKYKQLKKQIQNNIKAQRGFGYTHKEINFDS